MDIDLIREVLNKPVFLTGLMGAGKTSIGKEMSAILGYPFTDADSVIVERAGLSIPDIFDLYGEPRFRELERDVISGLSENDSPMVIGLGGGAFMDGQTRACIKKAGVSIFIKADLDILTARVGSGKGRPLLEQNANPRNKLKELMDSRYPVYEQADIVVKSHDEPLNKTTNKVMEALYMYLKP